VLRRCLPCLLLLACAHTPVVERAYDGHVVRGRFIVPEAYAAFLRGSVAEADGDLPSALASYEEASRLDSRAAEVWTRIGAVRCRANPRDPLADASFARALEREERYARAWAAKATCDLARGDLAGARAAAGRAASLDPSADGANALLSSTAPPAQGEAARTAFLALTVTARDPTTAWDALASWAEAHGDVSTWARALEELARISPAHRDKVARGAEKLAGVGESWEAREVAAAAADVEPRPLAEDHALAARLAVDEAIARGDAGAVSRRATRVRLPLDEAAARALLRGSRPLARELAREVALADPGAVGAQLVLAGTDDTDVVGAAHDVRVSAEVPSAAAFVAFAAALTHRSSPAHARTALAGLAHTAVLPGDDLVVRAAVGLAVRGAIGADVLPPDGIVELAALLGAAPGAELQSPGARGLDARHEFLAVALGHPESERARALGVRFATMGRSDPIVAAALALVQFATGAATANATARGLLGRDAGDPLLAAVALRIAEKAGDRDVARRAREALTALGGRSGASVE
jgi:Tfp pilus assembly protein PilF